LQYAVNFHRSGPGVVPLAPLKFER
jgi:hypothetical protein